MGAAVAANWLMGALIAQGAYSGKRTHQQAENTREDAQTALDEQKAAKKKQDALLRQGVQETATTVVEKDPNASTGGVELSAYKQLQVGNNAGANV